jgi:hypothetical protein
MQFDAVFNQGLPLIRREDIHMIDVGLREV